MSVAAQVSAPEDTRERIRKVALELFAAQGFETTSLREIADRLGFTKAALYYHFPSKDQLLESLMVPLLGEVDTLLDQTAGRATDAAAQRQFLADYLHILLTNRRLIAWLANDLAVLAHPAVGPRARAQGERIRRMLGDSGLSLSDQVRVTAALGVLQTGVAAFPDTPEAQLREPLLAAARAVLEASL